LNQTQGSFILLAGGSIDCYQIFMCPSNFFCENINIT